MIVYFRIGRWQKKRDGLYSGTRKQQTASRILPVKNMVKAVGTLKVSRKASDKAYHLLVKFINAYALIEGDSQYLNFIYYVNTVIVHYLREAIGQ